MKQDQHSKPGANVLRRFAYSGAVAAVVFAASYSGIALINLEGGVSPIWAANALIVYFAMRKPPDELPRIVFVGIAARFLAGLMSGTGLVMTFALSFRDFIEVAIVAIPLQALDAYRDFGRPKNLLSFYAIAAGPAPLVSAAISGALFQYARVADFHHVFVDVYAAHALGLMVILPVLSTVRLKAMFRMFRADQLPQTLWLIGIVMAVVGAEICFPSHPLDFLFFPALLLLTFRRSFEGGALGILLVVCSFVWATLGGHPAHALQGLPFREQILLGESFIAVIAFTVILTGAALEERRKLERGLLEATSQAESAREEALNAREEALVAKEAAEKASHMKSMFLATMSHELRTPLNAVIGFSQLLEAETFGPLGNRRYRNYAGIIEKAGQHLLDLINDILDMSKIEAGKFELQRKEVDCKAIIDDCANLISARAKEHNIVVEKDVPPESIRFDADPRAIKQILLNLLSNAVKFTPAGGRVTVRLREQGGLVTLIVSDTGVGIPADQLALLGNPFVTLRSSVGASQEGTGLGLALARALTQLHGGTFKVESDEGQGTTVTVVIPVEQRKSLAA